jgi:hypothetical protein
VYARGSSSSPFVVTVTERTPFTPEAVTHGAAPVTADAWRRKYVTFLGAVSTSTCGDGPADAGYSSQGVPSSSTRSPGAPKLIPSRSTGSFTERADPRNVHISASGSGTRASDVWSG